MDNEQPCSSQQCSPILRTENGSEYYIISQGVDSGTMNGGLNVYSNVSSLNNGIVQNDVTSQEEESDDTNDTGETVIPNNRFSINHPNSSQETSYIRTGGGEGLTFSDYVAENNITNVGQSGKKQLPSFQQTFGRKPNCSAADQSYQQYTNILQSQPNNHFIGPTGSGNYWDPNSHGQNNQSFIHAPVSTNQNECLGKDIFYFLKACVRELNKAMTQGPIAPRLSSCILILEDIHKVIIADEEKFTDDLLNNSHKNHKATFCGHEHRDQNNAGM